MELPGHWGRLGRGSLAHVGLGWRPQPLEVLRLDAKALGVWEAEDIILQPKQGALLRQFYSRRQLRQCTVEFWTDHFNISVRKGDCWFLKPVDAVSAALRLLHADTDGGRVHGMWPGLSQEQLFGPGDLAVTTDYREVLAEVCRVRLNNPATEQIFPGFNPSRVGFVR